LAPCGMRAPTCSELPPSPFSAFFESSCLLLLHGTLTPLAFLLFADRTTLQSVLHGVTAATEGRPVLASRAASNRESKQNCVPRNYHSAVEVARPERSFLPLAVEYLLHSYYSPMMQSGAGKCLCSFAFHRSSFWRSVLCRTWKPIVRNVQGQLACFAKSCCLPS